MEISPQVDEIVKILNSSNFESVEVCYEFKQKRQEWLGQLKLVKGDNFTEILAAIEEKPGFQAWGYILVIKEGRIDKIKLTTPGNQPTFFK